jgi:hypothetical protein
MGTTWSDIEYRPLVDLDDGSTRGVSHGWRHVPSGFTVHDKSTGRSGDVFAMHDKGLAAAWHDEPPHSRDHRDIKPHHQVSAEQIGDGAFEIRRFGEPAVLGRRPGRFGGPTATAPNYSRKNVVREMVESGDVDGAINRLVAEGTREI